jgi:outer membrane protein assembly factor BamB
MDDKELLERALRQYPAAPGAAERVMRRRVRKRRAQRIEAGIVAVLVSIATFGFVLKVFDTDASKRPAGIERSHSITPRSVARLKLVWTGAGPNQPLAMEGGVVLAADSGRSTLYAFDRSCASSGEECAALWTATSGSTSGTGSSPTSVAVDGSTVYLATQDRLSTFPLRCRSDGATCDPTSARDARTWSWQDAPTFGSIPPAISDGNAYVVSGGILAAYPTSCLDETCAPTWTWESPDGRPLGPPAIVGGDVLVQTAGGRFLAFSGACASGCEPLWSSRALYDPYAWVSSSDTVAVVGFKHANLVAFSLSCAGERSCVPSFTGADLGPGVRMANSFATVGDTLYLVQGGPESAVNGTPTYQGGGNLLAVSLSCMATDGACEPITIGRIPAEFPPAIAGGVLFASDGPTLSANAEDCVVSGRTCPPLWSWTARGGSRVDLTQPVIADGEVFVASFNHEVFAFSIHD